MQATQVRLRRVYTREANGSTDDNASARTFASATQAMHVVQAKLFLGLRLRLRHLRSHLEICEAEQTQAGKACVCVKLNSHCVCIACVNTPL